MKRGSVGLVEYSSSEDEQPDPVVPTKKRKLPTLSTSLTVPTPVDNPALHQGRVRTVPHVEGQYATHIYIPLLLHHKDPLHTLVEEVLNFSKERVPSLHAIGRHDGSIKPARWELHISLSRPLFLRSHQREEFKQSIRQLASSIAPFEASFATFSEFTNDERTRTFLAFEVGAGHAELRRCLDLLGPTLRSLRQRDLYADPKFHASVAWALLEKTAQESNISSLSTAGELDEFDIPQSTTPEIESLSPPTASETSSDDFQQIPHFPSCLIPSLNQAYATRLSQARTGGFVVDQISVKIGKDVFTCPLHGGR